MNRYLLLLTLVVSLGFVSDLNASSAALDTEIDQLIQAVGESGCTFVRNGKQHTARESVKHISRKYAHFEDEIDSIESFVALTATQSLMTGKAYEVRCDGLVLTSEQWLLNKAQELGLSLQAGSS